MQRAILRDFSVESASFITCQPSGMILGMPCVRDRDEDSPVPDAVAEVTDDPVALLDVSRRIATHLDAVQRPKVNSSGLVAVIYGKGRGTDCLTILKMERERGVRFAITTVSGRHIRSGGPSWS